MFGLIEASKSEAAESSECVSQCWKFHGRAKCPCKLEPQRIFVDLARRDSFNADATKDIDHLLCSV